MKQTTWTCWNSPPRLEKMLRRRVRSSRRCCPARSVTKFDGHFLSTTQSHHGGTKLLRTPLILTRKQLRLARTSAWDQGHTGRCLMLPQIRGNVLVHLHVLTYSSKPNRGRSASIQRPNLSFRRSTEKRSRSPGCDVCRGQRGSAQPCLGQR